MIYYVMNIAIFLLDFLQSWFGSRALIALLLILPNCATNHSNIEICFDNIQSRIKSDSILTKIAYSPIDRYGEFAAIINRAVTEESKSNSICSTSIDEFLLKNNKNSVI